MNKIKEFRKTLKITQSDLANSLNLSQGAISHYESGRRFVDLDTCREITNFFIKKGVKTSVDELFPPKKATNAN